MARPQGPSLRVARPGGRLRRCPRLQGAYLAAHRRLASHPQVGQRDPRKEGWQALTARRSNDASGVVLAALRQKTRGLGDVGHQELHLIGQDAPVTQDEVLPQTRHIGRIQQRHVCLLWSAGALAVVAGAALSLPS